MKKLLSIVLSILIIVPCTLTSASDGYTPPVDEITKEEAYQFADELKEMNSEKYDTSNRLIVSSDKDIDYLNPIVAIAVGGIVTNLFYEYIRKDSKGRIRIKRSITVRRGIGRY